MDATRLGWFRFLRLLRVLPSESLFRAALEEDEEPDWRTALDLAMGAEPGPRRKMSVGELMAHG